jgi:diadenosine tetraphosphate (Ap4A) HIT family hydrolase
LHAAAAQLLLDSLQLSYCVIPHSGFQVVTVSAWHDKDRWAALLDESECPICRNGKPDGVVAELDASWVTMSETAPMRGYACLVARHHVIELHDLTAEEGTAFMNDARRLSRAIAQAVQPIKLNYEIHGNTVPHLHVHFLPRYIGDPFEGQPINPRSIVSPVYSRGEFAAVRDAIRRALDEGAV